MPTKQSQPNPAALVRVARRRLDSITFAELVGHVQDAAHTRWVREAVAADPYCVEDLGRTTIVAGDGITPWPAWLVQVRKGERVLVLTMYLGQDGEWGCVERLPKRAA